MLSAAAGALQQIVAKGALSLGGLLKRKHAAAEAGEIAAAPSAKKQRPGVVVEFKVVLVGDGGVGKTTMATRHASGSFTQKYVPTVGVDIRRLSFETNCGTVVFNLWDTAGQEKFGGLRDGYYMGADAAVVLFDVTSRVTYSNVPKWCADIRNTCGDIPLVLIGNKVDSNDRELKVTQLNWHRSRGIQYYDMSAKTGFNIEKPFLYLARRLCNNQALQFVGDFAGAPSLSPTRAAAAARLERDLALARSVRIDDDDDL